MSTYAAGDIAVLMCNASGNESLCIGIAAEAAASGDFLTVYTDGLFIVRTANATAAGAGLGKAGSSDYEEVDVLTAGDAEEIKIGKALTGAAATDGYLIMKLNVG